MANSNAYANFVLKACRVRNRLIKDGKSQVPAAKSHKDIKRLTLWLEFHGNKGLDKVQDWFKREAATIEAVITPKLKNEFKELLNSIA